MPCQGRSRRRRGPTASLYGAWRSAKLGHWDRRLNATQSGNFKPLVFGEIHAAGNSPVTLRDVWLFTATCVAIIFILMITAGLLGQLLF